jgi:hypothetical protein
MASWLGPPVEKYDYGTNGGSWTRQPAVIVIHSTEGKGWTNYNNGSVAPHFTIEPKSGEIHQHISLAHAARALAHPSGTPETNRAGAVQIEVIGTCDPANKGKSGWNYLPDMSDAQCANLNALLVMIEKACGIALTAAAEFEAYPEPGYGSGYPRLSDSAWSKVKGVVGHQHVPSNTHGDPGNIPIERILDDMPSANEVAEAVWHCKITNPITGGPAEAQAFEQTINKSTYGTLAMIRTLADAIGGQALVDKCNEAYTDAITP